MSTQHYGASATAFAAACSLHSLICANTDKYMDRLKDYLRDHMAANNFNFFEIDLRMEETTPICTIHAIKPDKSKYLVAECWNEPTGIASFTYFYWEA